MSQPDEKESHSTGLYKDADSVLGVIWINARRKALKLEDIDGVAAIWKEAHELYQKIRTRLYDYAASALSSYEFHKREGEPCGTDQESLDKTLLNIFGNESSICLTAEIEACEEGGFHISIKDFPGVHSQGETIKEAEKNVMDALKTIVTHRVSIEGMLGPSPEKNP